MTTFQATDLDSVAERYGKEWSIWRSRRGRLVCATRRRRLTRNESHAGLDVTLIADTVADLVWQLERQARIATRL